MKLPPQVAAVARQGHSSPPGRPSAFGSAATGVVPALAWQGCGSGYYLCRCYTSGTNGAELTGTSQCCQWGCRVCPGGACTCNEVACPR
jgi:hypothetical protein